LLEKGRVTIPQELRSRLGLRKGDKIKFLIEGETIRLVIPNLEEDVVAETAGILKGIEPEMTPEELEEAFLTSVASKIKARKKLDENTLRRFKTYSTIIYSKTRSMGPEQQVSCAE